MSFSKDESTHCDTEIFFNKISTKQRRVDLLRIVRGRGSSLFFIGEIIQFALLLKCGKFSPRNNFLTILLTLVLIKISLDKFLVTIYKE